MVFKLFLAYVFSILIFVIGYIFFEYLNSYDNFYQNNDYLFMIGGFLIIFVYPTPNILKFLIVITLFLIYYLFLSFQNSLSYHQLFFNNQHISDLIFFTAIGVVSYYTIDKLLLYLLIFAVNK